jgi:hypothetical protein
MSDLARILSAIRPGAGWTLEGDTLAGLTWLDPEQPCPTPEEIDAARPAVLAALALAEVQAQRAAAYREEADPLYFQEQAGEVPAGTWAAKRDEIRDRLPLPGA